MEKNSTSSTLISHDESNKTHQKEEYQLSKLTLSENILKVIARYSTRLPLPIIKALSGKPIEIDGQTLDPLVQFMVKFFTDKPGYLPSPEQERHDFDVKGDWFTHLPEPTVEITPMSITGPNGLVNCEVHRPKNLPQQNAPVLLFFHGGGHVSGSLVSHRNICRQLAHEVNCAVMAVDYRLAPEHKFPVGINDCLAAYDHAAAHADELGFDATRISVGGDSAGGNIAAVIAQQRKDAPQPPKFQILWVPWVDMSKQTRSYELMGRGFFLEKVKMEWYTDHYLNTTDDGLNPLASPLLGDVTGVCPAALLIAGFDPLRDEGHAYAEKLKAAGVSTHAKVYTGLVHPFINVAGYIPAARSAFDDAVRELKAHM